jgi:hypothetical protein
MARRDVIRIVKMIALAARGRPASDQSSLGVIRRLRAVAVTELPQSRIKNEVQTASSRAKNVF